MKLINLIFFLAMFNCVRSQITDSNKVKTIIKEPDEIRMVDPNMLDSILTITLTTEELSKLDSSFFSIKVFLNLQGLPDSLEIVQSDMNDNFNLNKITTNIKKYLKCSVPSYYSTFSDPSKYLYVFITYRGKMYK